MILKTLPQDEYELIDTGEGQKLERYGPYVLCRPDPEAIWKKILPQDKWKNADMEFIRNGNRTKWITKEGVAKNWNISFGNLSFQITPSSFKHTGLFPEQLLNWQWMENVIKNRFVSSQTAPSGPRVKSPDHAVSLSNSANQIPRVLNLFAYTGGATLACAKAGAEVCHVDGSKTAVLWARRNAELSGLKNAPIRWIVEDVLMFLRREIKRGHRYDAIIMDPPSFGHGPKDELWKIESNFLELMELCKQILSDKPLFVLINGYTAGYSAIAYQNNLMYMMEGYNGNIEIGELTIKETSTERLLPCGIFARWSNIV
ncbi:MAG: class I SAM-dependent methyltransferase [Patescibacteria group bacterium]|nr:class I SAM-dependent methyltransferase [Patescibacteria group bacterium]